MWRRGIVCGLLYLIVLSGKSQGTTDSISFTDGQLIEVGRNVTTNLVFHFRIKQVDRGTGGLLARGCNDTVLLLRAASASLSPTNLSVYTADGKLHAFWVRYAEKPAHPWVRLEDTLSGVRRMADRRNLTEDQLAALCDSVWMEAAARRGKTNRQYNLRWRLRGVYTRSGLLFFPLEFINRSAIDYDLERVRFTIQDKRRSRRMATQERELDAVYIRGDTSCVTAGECRRLVFVLPVFTAPGKRWLHIAVEEKGSGRELSVDISSRRLMRAEHID